MKKDTAISKYPAGIWLLILIAFFGAFSPAVQGQVPRQKDVPTKDNERAEIKKVPAEIKMFVKPFVSDDRIR